MENENTNQNELTCGKCGGGQVAAELLAGNGPLVAAKVRSAISLGITRGSAVAARVCTVCGLVELHAVNPEILK